MFSGGSGANPNNCDGRKHGCEAVLSASTNNPKTLMFKRAGFTTESCPDNPTLAC